jgi:hypothetical protein
MDKLSGDLGSSDRLERDRHAAARGPSLIHDAA